MSKFYDALTKLKKAMADLSGKKMTRNADNLNNLDDSKQNFVNPKFLPADMKFPSGAVSTENTSYADNIIQAIWNIADIAINIGIKDIPSFISNPKLLTQNFDYLGEDWTPKIIDNTTYQAGKALKEILDALLNDASVFEEFPFSYMKQSIIDLIKDQLIPISQLLDTRLKFYENCTPENLNSDIENRERLYSLQDERVLYFNSINEEKHNLSKLIHTKIEALDSLESLSAQLEQIEKQKKRVEEKYKELKINTDNQLETIKEFKTFETNDFYSEIYQYYKALKVSNQILSESLQQHHSERIISSSKSFYDGTIEFREKNVETELTHYDGYNIKTIITTLENAQKYIEKLQEKIQAIKTLQNFEKAIEEQIPPLLEEQNFVSQHENKRTALKENIDFQKKYLEQLISYRKSLKEQLAKIENEAIPENLPEEYRTVYKNMPKELFKENLEAIEQRIQFTKEQKDSLELEFAKLSAIGRKQAIDAANAQIHAAYNTSNRAKNLDFKQRTEYLKFSNNEYQPALKAINEDPRIGNTEAEIQATKEELKKFDDLAASRRSFLTEAQKKLENFKQILVESKEIYLDITKIPQSELIKYLELNPNSPEAQELAELYPPAEQGFFGNLSTRFSQYASIGISVFDLNKLELEKSIDRKLKQLTDEQQIKNLNNQVNNSANTKNLAENNLYILSGFYQKLTTKLEENTNLHESLVAKKNKQMEFWEQRNLQETDKFLESNFNALLEKINHRLSMANLDAIQLDFDLDDLEQQIDEKDLKSLVVIQQKLNQNFSHLANQLNAEEKALKLPEGLKKTDLPEFLQEKLIAVESKIKQLQKHKASFQTRLAAINTAIEIKLKRDAEFKQDLESVMEKSKSVGNEIKNLSPQNKLVGINKATLSQKPLVKNVELIHKPLKQQIETLKESYFGNNQGVIAGKFGSYLSLRAQGHWFKDYLSSFAAMIFGVDYKTPIQQRTDYLLELSNLMDNYQPGYYYFVSIKEKLEEGQKLFSPEAQDGEAFDKTLAALLSTLKEKFDIMEKEPHLDFDSAEPGEESSHQLNL